MTFLFTIIISIHQRSNTIWDFYQLLSSFIHYRNSTVAVSTGKVPLVRKIIIPRHYRLSNQDTIIDIQTIAIRAIQVWYVRTVLDENW